MHQETTFTEQRHAIPTTIVDNGLMGADHEVLTTDGWKSISTVSLEDKVACLENDKVIYRHPIQLLHYNNYKGRMYKIKNEHIDLEVSPNHRMLVSKEFGTKKKWLSHALEKAEGIKGKHRKYKKDGLWERDDYQFTLPAIDDIPEKAVDMQSWLLFSGIWLANRFTRNIGEIYIPHRKRNVIGALLTALEKLEVDFSVLGGSYYKFFIEDKQILKFLSESLYGCLPDWTWELSAGQARALINALLLGSGSKSNSLKFSTSSEGLARDFMRLCLHAGWSAIMTEIQKELWDPISDEQISCGDYQLEIVKSKNSPAVNQRFPKTQEEELFDFEGPVYGLSVPLDIFYISRNGKPCWTGGSHQ